MSGGSTNFQLPRWRSLSASQSKKSVSDAIRPAAAGIGAAQPGGNDPAACQRRRDSAVKSGEPQRAAGEIDKRHDPAGARKLLEHDPINQECGCEAERNNVGKRIELAAERTVVTTQSRQSAIEEIKNEGAKNKPDRGVKKIGGNIRV